MWFVRFLLLVVCFAGSYGQGSLFTSPDPNGMTFVDLDEDAKLATTVLIVSSINTNDNISIVSVTDVAGSSSQVDTFLLSTKVIITTKPLNFETVQAYLFVLQAISDGMTPQQTSMATFILHVNDVNDETPVIGSLPQNVVMQEESAAGTTIPFSFVVSDADAGDKLTYSLSGLHSSYFSVDKSSGKIVVNKKLDRDAVGAITTYDQLTLTVTDAVGHTATAGLSVTLTDINDNAPVCSPNLYAVNINENTVQGTSVATVFCNDIDVGVNADMTYSIFSGDDATAKFSLSSATVMTTSNPLDYETMSSYILVVKVADRGTTPLTCTATVLVTVIGVNEFQPVLGVFSPSGPSYGLSESVGIGTTVFKMIASDLDKGPDGQIEYVLISTTAASNPVSGIFKLDTNGGQLLTDTTFDYESGVITYEVVVEAKDKGSPAMSNTTTLVIGITDANDNSPTFSLTLYSASVPESSALAGSSVVQLTATDADSTKATLLYQIVSGDSLNKFRFSSVTSGLLELNSNIDPDDPTNDPTNYVIIVQVSDMGVPTTPARTGTSSVTVTVTPSNDNFPVIGTPTPFISPSVAEDVSIGTSVATVPVTDADNDNGVSQAVILTIANGNTNNVFNIDSNTGVVTTAKRLDYEATASYQLVILATDNGTPAKSSSMTLTITVTNVNENAPNCPSSIVYATVPENAISYPVATLVCSDSDAGDSLTYSIVPADASFSVGASSGSVSTILSLNYESRSTHTLTIHVTDSLTVVKTSTVTLSVSVQPVNEYPPVFAPVTYTLTLAENVVAGTSVVTVTATDNDQGALDGTIRFSIVAGNGDGAFTINSSSGKVETTGVGLDFEKRKTHTLIIKASDDVPGASTERSASCTVVITVTDINDNAPLCIQPLPVNIVEPSIVGASITTLTSIDDDESGMPNATPSYSVISGDVYGTFTMVGSALKLAKVVDYETQTSFNITIRVSDSGTPAPLTSTCVVYITIIAANEFPPLMTIPNYSTTIPETIPIGTTVFQAISTDADKGTGSTFTYSITSGNTNGDFFCYPDTGIIIVWNHLDFDTPPQTYNLTVTSTDEGGKSGSMWLYVSLLDSNDQTPVFTSNVYAISVQENVALGSSVGAVSAVDSDTSTGGTVTYTVVSGNGMTRFSVNSATGVITTIANIDREVRGRYSLVVRAADGGTPSLSSTSLVDITIADLNDNAPVFTPTDFTVSLSEDVSVGTTVTTVNAVDVDSAASNNVFSYVLTNSYFQVDATTGVITTRAALDRETKAVHTLIILAPDAGVPSLTGTATVTVVLDDINDNSPIVVGTYDKSIIENIALGTVVTTIATTDADSGVNARLNFVVVSGNTDNDFYLSPASGTVQVRNSLDRERTQFYTLVVKVTDNGFPVLSTTATLTVTISDMNDNSPVWATSSYAFTALENQAAGTTVGQISATDADLGTNSAVMYSLILFWIGNPAHFDLDPSTGFITTRVSLDRETTPQYVAILSASDGGNPSRSAEVNVTINVGDLNDNTPAFSASYYTGSTFENRPAGTSVMTLAVADADSGTNGNVALSIDWSTTGGTRAALFFDVTSGTGIIAVKSVIDHEVDKSFSFVVLAIDGGNPALTSSANVTITVADMNDHAPIFTKTYYNAEVAYSGQCETSITTVTAMDADSDVNGKVYYYQDVNTYDDMFSVDSATGVFSMSKTLTANIMYTRQVSARDGGSPALTSTTPITIRVDAMVPDNVILIFHLGITPAAFTAQKTAFLAECQALVRKSYPSALARLWCVQTSSQGLADVYVYFLKDFSTEIVDNINAAKYYVSAMTARPLFTKDVDGTPSNDLSGSSWSTFNVKNVSPFYESQTLWAQTKAGIAIITVCSLIGVCFFSLAAYMMVKYTRVNLQTRPQIRQIKVKDNFRRHIVTPSEKGQSGQPQSEWNDSFFWNGSTGGF